KTPARPRKRPTRSPPARSPARREGAATCAPERLPGTPGGVDQARGVHWVVELPILRSARRWVDIGATRSECASGSVEARAPYANTPALEKEESGVRRIRTADLLGAIQARGQNGSIFTLLICR